MSEEQAYISTEEELTCLREEVKTLRTKLEDSQFQLRNLKKVVYGKKSEKVPPPIHSKQLSLYDCEVEATNELEIEKEFEEEVKEENIEKETKTKPKKHRGRKSIPRTLKEEEIIIEAPEKAKVDETGEKLCLLGYETNERLHVEPARFIRLTIKREKWGYKESRDVISIASPPKAIVAKGKFTDALVHEIVFQKYFMALPLHRQMLEYNTLGAAISKSTMCDSVKKFASFYEPIYKAIKAEVFSSKFIHIDETPIKAMRVEEKKYKKGYYWVYRIRDACYFHFGKDRSARQIRDVFDFSSGPPPDDAFFDNDTKKWFGIVMSDAYIGYQKAKDENVITGKRMACWAHVRRKFYEIANFDKTAASLLTLINKLYHFEKEVDKKRKKEKWAQNVFWEKRFNMRQHSSKPIIDEIFKIINDGKYALLPPQAPLSKAITYAQKLQEYLEVYLSDGELPIDNNAAENSIRPLVIGRKNYLFLGSEDGGAWAALCYTLMESCRLMNIDPKEYLNKATLALHEGRTDYQNLTPKNLSGSIGSLKKDK